MKSAGKAQRQDNLPSGGTPSELAAASLFKLKQHVDNPGQTPM